jgi:hypothetical protein
MRTTSIAERATDEYRSAVSKRRNQGATQAPETMSSETQNEDTKPCNAIATTTTNHQPQTAAGIMAIQRIQGLKSRPTNLVDRRAAPILTRTECRTGPSGWAQGQLSLDYLANIAFERSIVNRRSCSKAWFCANCCGVAFSKTGMRDFSTAHSRRKCREPMLTLTVTVGA